ncbi:MAG: hypothetical protein ACO1OX_06865 [Novosphingobium sp.]
MSFDRFATVMILVGAGMGLAATSLVPTDARSPERLQPFASVADYPEIVAVTYETYPVATAPLFRRTPLELASWEKPWAEPAGYDQDELPAENVAADIPVGIDPQLDEDEYGSADHPVEVSEGFAEPAEITLAAHP